MKRVTKAALVAKRCSPSARGQERLELKFEPLKQIGWCSLCFREGISIGAIVRCVGRGTFNLICGTCVACLADANHESNREQS